MCLALSRRGKHAGLELCKVGFLGDFGKLHVTQMHLEVVIVFMSGSSILQDK